MLTETLDRAIASMRREIATAGHNEAAVETLQADIAALARLREELPKIVEEMRLCLRVDTKHTLCIKDWLARLEEGE